MKTIQFAILIGTVLTFYSCEKQYTCTCRDDQSNEITNISTYELSRSDAESACENADAEEGVYCILDE
ncbi:MAG: hypothetical protein AAGI23_14445 [Bacteroidota bacterium]